MSNLSFLVYAFFRNITVAKVSENLNYLHKLQGELKIFWRTYLRFQDVNKREV